jgi:hypothetical protein
MNHDDDLSDIRRQGRQGKMQGQRLSPLLSCRQWSALRQALRRFIPNV